MRVVLVGDSRLTDTSPHGPITKLGPRLRRAGLDVVTVASGGANSRDALRQAIPDVVDWIVYSVGTNDAAPWKTVPLDEFAANCDALMTISFQAHRLVLGLGPVVEHPSPGGRTSASLAAYTGVLERVARTHDAGFVSTTDLLDHDDLTVDGIHLSDSGYRKLADRLLREFEVVSSR